MNTSSQQLGPIYRLPVEVLLQIFSEFDWDGSKPYILVTVQETCPWFQFIRMRTTLLLVCRSWYNILLPTLYRFVYLYKIEQLATFARTVVGLDRSNRGISHCVKHLQCDFYIPERLSNAYFRDMKTLVKHCRNVQTLVLRPFCPYTAEPFDTTLMLPHYREEVPFPGLVELTMGPEALITATRLELGISHFQHLTKLHMVISPRVSRVGLEVRVMLPNLTTLTCEFSARAAYETASIIAKSWSLPELQNLSVNLIWRHYPLESPPSLKPIESLCQAYGHGLQSLRIDNRITRRSFKSNLSSILTACPRLTYIEYPDRWIPVSKREGHLEQSKSLRTVAFLPETLSPHNFGPTLGEHLARYMKRSVFQVLDTIVLLIRQVHGTTIGASNIHEDDIEVLLILSKQLGSLGIRFLNCDLQPIRLSHEESDEDNDMDTSDEDFIPDSQHSQAETLSSEDELEVSYIPSSYPEDELMQLDNEETLDIFDEHVMILSDEDYSD